MTPSPDDLVGEMDVIETLCANHAVSGALTRVATLERELSESEIRVDALQQLFDKLREAIYSGHSARMVSAAADLRAALADYLEAHAGDVH